ncbi:MAG: CHASE domain-containing protein [Rhodocyclaceae bacterium]|nr:CHASE domain-containing protein [Rhodocyclaceae bacterium]
MAVSRLLLLPWLILVASLGVTALLWDHERQSNRGELRAQFDFALRDTVSRVEQRVAAYEQLLRGVQGLFATTDMTNRKAFRDYVETLQLDANFSGIQGVGIIERVPSAHKSAHVAAMRRLGYADYRISPDGEREIYGPIIQREPHVGRNRAPLGSDAWAEPVRRSAMEKARDSGLAAVTGKVQLAVDPGVEENPGFIMVLPVFARGQPRDSVAQRRASLIGWVYASFHMRDFMASLYGKQVPGLAFAIYDDVDTTDGALMYRAGTVPGKRGTVAHDALSANEYMIVAGHTWTLMLSTQEEFEARYGRDTASVIAVTGVGLSLSMALLGWFMVTGRARALRLAAEMTEELRHMAQHDPLTGLPNRALFSDRVQRQLADAKRHGGRFAMIFLDLDNFKPINDNYGHAVGDRLLQLVARRLQDSIRASDTVGRIGGDEFVVLMADLSGPDAALGLAEKIREVVRQPLLVDGRELNISCSLGVAVYPDNGTDEMTLTKCADESMYRAKAGGRDCIQLAG